MCCCCHVLFVIIAIFIVSCFIFVRRLEISVTERSPILPSLIVMDLFCSPSPIYMSWRQRFPWRLFLFMVMHCPEGTCRFTVEYSGGKHVLKNSNYTRLVTSLCVTSTVLFLHTVSCFFTSSPNVNFWLSPVQRDHTWF